MFGCGGERDAGKRPQMAAIAERLADGVIVTDDNPRGGDGDAIVADILRGFADASRVLVERDRARAIGWRSMPPTPTTSCCRRQGHEPYQEIAGVRHPFDDTEVAKAALGGAHEAARLAQLAQWCGGRLHGDDAEVDAVSTDTRTLAGDGRRVLFVALKGENFDGHEHVANAAARPARSPALVSRELEIDLPQVVVADTERALGAFAAAMQERRATKVLAVTGSNGKTSVKSLLLAILAHAGTRPPTPATATTRSACRWR